MNTVETVLQRVLARPLDVPHARQMLQALVKARADLSDPLRAGLLQAYADNVLSDTEFAALLEALNAAPAAVAPDATLIRSRGGPAVPGTQPRVPTAPPPVQPPAPEPITPGTASPAATTGSSWDNPHDWTGVWEEAKEGDVLKGRYRLERRIGEGGMGIVFRAIDLESEGLGADEVLAVKILKPAFRSHPDALRALNEEVRKGRILAHPNIVSAYSFNRDQHNVFMTMEFLEGKPLDVLLDEEFARGMPFAQAWPIIEGMGSALAYAHDRGIVHSDFKPSNVFVLAGGRTKVLDFGIARAARGSRSQRFDAGELGAMTPTYASCEMIENAPPDDRDDIYGLGCVIYELLSGKHPFDRKSAVEARDTAIAYHPIVALSKAQNRAIAGAVAFDRAKRTESVEAVLSALQRGARSTSKMSTRIGIGAVLSIIFGIGLWAVMSEVGFKDSDEKIIESLVQPTAKTPDNFDPTRVQLLLDQGNEYLAQGKKQFDPAVLSEGVSTANGAFRAVLRLDPANHQAAVGIAEIFKLYRGEAKRYHDERQYRKALEVVELGLRIYPASEDLGALHTELEGRLSQPDRAPTTP